MDLIESSKKGRNFNFEITTTPSCDLNCSYCFEGKKKPDNNQVNSRVDLIIEKIEEMMQSEWFKKDYISMSLDFWGGEPTLNSKIMIDLMNYFKNTDNIDFHVYTNAYNLSNMMKFVNSVPKHKLRMQVSYDGKVINDKFRVTYTGKSSSDEVLETFDWLSKQGLAGLSFKSTLPVSASKDMHTVWLEFRDLHTKYNNNNVGVSYAPTLDYHTKLEDPNKYLQEFSNQCKMIARDELDFYQVNNRFLFSWFRGTDERFTCSAGKDISILDTDGNIYPCHGAIYLDDKEAHVISSLNNLSIQENINNSRTKFSEFISKTNETCKQCIATTCYVCPTSSYASSKKETYEDRWLDNQVHGICSFYQEFGRIDRAVLKILGGK